MTPHYSRRGEEALARGECVDPESYDVSDPALCLRCLDDGEEVPATDGVDGEEATA